MYTPSTIKLEFQDAIKKLTVTKTVVEITGVYFDQRKGNFGGFYYDRLQDNGNNNLLTILVPADKKASLEHGKTCKLRCLVEYKINKENKVELLINHWC